ncbi:hypothetical protein KIL84_007181 [Mauremys mutica]|uniref:Uncharacterized protein n=1 Tax=Mauremys mutica TaxID=74926 RepID=A0A9D3X286_9SAUR|nr:hypothetical protein KIL84_007181 [Mauremys mutica]
MRGRLQFPQIESITEIIQLAAFFALQPDLISQDAPWPCDSHNALPLLPLRGDQDALWKTKSSQGALSTEVNGSMRHPNNNSHEAPQQPFRIEPFWFSPKILQTLIFISLQKSNFSGKTPIFWRALFTPPPKWCYQRALCMCI